MKKKNMYIFVIILLSLIAPSIQKDEGLLHDHLLKNYSAFARPVRNLSTPVVVTFGFELKQITAIDESEQTITEKVWLRMSWVNEFMQWDPTSWGNITKTRFDYSKVWKPDIFLQEDVSSDMSTGPIKYKTHIVIYNNGSHTWFVPTLFQSSCDFNIEDFPFDSQSCTLVFTPWTHDKSEVDLKIDERPVITENYVESSEWDLISVDRKRRSKLYPCCPNSPYGEIRYTINLRRKPFYYVYNVVVPCIIQMVIILLTFLLPPDSGERVGVVITVMLVFAVYLEVLSESLPRTSTSTPALSRFYIAAMAESACSLIATCLVLIVHFKGTEKGAGPMPLWVRRFFIDGMPTFLYIRRRSTRRRKDDGLLAFKKKGSWTGLNAITDKHNAETNGGVKRDEAPVTNATLLEEVRAITALIREQDKRDGVEEEWNILGKIFDRIFFFVFLLIFLVTSAIFLLPMYGA